MHNKTKMDKTLLECVKCVKCGAHHRLVPLDLKDILSVKRNKESKNPESRKNLNSLVPVCTRCYLDFHRWKRFDTKYKRKMYKCTIYSSFFILLICDIILSSLLGIVLFCLIAGTCICYILKQSRKPKHMEFYPEKHMRYAKDGSLRLKSNFSSTWIEYSEWLKEVLYERIYLHEAVDIPFISCNKNDFFHCVYCGAKVRKTDINCFKCEKLLPLI